MHRRTMRSPRVLLAAAAVAGAIALAVAAAAVLLAPASSADHRVTAYAAASLSGALPRIEDARYSFAGSNQLQLQIARGAPADVFASASPKEPQALFHQGRCSRPVTFATNRLVLLVRRGDPRHIGSPSTLRRGGFRLAVGTAGVPVGDYTRRVLARMGLAHVLDSNVVSEESSVSGIVSKVALGSADAGFAYATDARAAPTRLDAIELPRAAQPPVRYQACVVRRPGGDGAGGQAFLRRLTSAHGRRVLAALGFGLPPRG